MLNFSVDSKVVALDRVSWSEMSLSSAKAVGLAHNYCLQVGLDRLAPVMASWYETLIGELKRDDTRTEERDWFATAGYPPLMRLLEMPDLLARVLETYYVSELLSLALGPPKAKPEAFVVDGIDSVRIDNSVILIEGTCYSFRLDGYAG